MMDQTVALLLASVCLFGTALGLRFSVYVLIPAGLAILIVSSMALIWNNMAAPVVTDRLLPGLVTEFML